MVVDVGTIQHVAKTVCVEVCGVEVPVISRGWVYHFRKRHGISNLRKITTERTPSSEEGKVTDNAWRSTYKDIVEDPAQYGLPTGDGPRAIPPELQLAADETALKYAPVVTFGYGSGGAQHVRNHRGNDKRQITSTPVVSKSENMLCFQFVARQKTARSHAQWPPRVASKVVYQHDTAKKMQTSEIFRRLLREVHERLKEVKEMIGVPQDYPAVPILDWVASDKANEPFKPVQGPRKSGHLFQSTDFSDIFAFFGRRGRSHITNPLDQLINLSLRKWCRERFRDRDV